MSMHIRVDSDEVIAALDELDRKASRGSIQKALAAVGKFLKPKVKAAAPKGPTGNLRRQVRYKRVRGQADQIGGVVVRSFARHAHLVSLGTGARFTRNGAFRGSMPSNPYVSRVADQNEEAALRIAEAELARQLDL